MKRFAFLIETAAGLAILWMFNLLLDFRNPGFLGITPHPYLFLLALMTARYGYIKGLPTTLLVTASYLICLYSTKESPAWYLFTPIAGFVIFHTILGMISDGHKKKLKKTETHIQSLTRVSEALESEKQKVEQHNNELSRRLLSERSTFAILYRAARKLSTLDEKFFFDGITTLTKEVIDADNSAIFLINGNTLRLKTALDPKKINMELMDQEILDLVIKEKKTFSIKDAVKKDETRKDEVFLCGPLLLGSEGDIYGIITIFGLNFLKYNPTTVRMFTLICDWASICLENIMKYNERLSETFKEEYYEEWSRKARESFDGLFEFGTGTGGIEEKIENL